MMFIVVIIMFIVLKNVPLLSAYFLNNGDDILSDSLSMLRDKQRAVMLSLLHACQAELAHSSLMVGMSP